MEEHQKNQSRRRITFQEFLKLFSEFQGRTATLRDPNFECKATLEDFRSKTPTRTISACLVFTDLKRRRRFSRERFEDFHEHRRLVEVGHKTLFELFDNGKSMYIALWPSVNHIYLTKLN